MSGLTLFGVGPTTGRRPSWGRCLVPSGKSAVVGATSGVNSASKMTGDPRHPRKVRARDAQEAKFRCGNACAGCHTPLQPWCEVDHIIPLWKGGTNHARNLQPLCAECHARKSWEEHAERRRTFIILVEDKGILWCRACRKRLDRECTEHWCPELGPLPVPAEHRQYLDKRMDIDAFFAGFRYRPR